MSDYIIRQLDVYAMLEALYETSFAVWKKWGVINQRDSAWAVADYKTIGVSAGRQCGLTRGAFKWLLKHPGECVMIAKDRVLSRTHESNYRELEGGNPDDVIWLVPKIQETLKSWTKEIGEERIPKIKFIIVDDSALTLNAGYVRRSDFNKWIADTFGADTFVILIK